MRTFHVPVFRLILSVLTFGTVAPALSQTPAFLPAFQTNIWAVAKSNAPAQSYSVPTTNANVLLVVSNAATTNLNVTTGNPGNGIFGVINYTPTSSPSTNTFQVIASNSVSSNIATTNLTITSEALPPLQVRIFDMRATQGPAQILPVGTGANDLNGDCTFFYVTGGTTNLVSNGFSVNFSNLPTAVATNEYGTNTYRTMYLSNVQSGTLWVGLTTNQYSNALTAGNPAGTAAPDVQWSQAPFGEIEYSFTGGGYDTADVTLINTIAVPAMLRLASTNGLYPGSTPVGLTNPSTLASVIPDLILKPGVNWFGAAPNTNLVRLLGPSSANAGEVQMAYGAAGTNAGNYNTGWPGFSASPMSPYVSRVAEATTNPASSNTNPAGGPWGQTRIVKQIGDPDVTSWARDSQWYFSADLTFIANTNPAPQWGPLGTNYRTPVPVLTNVTITNIVILANGTSVTNSYTTNQLAVAYTPDNGSPTQASFSSYIYGAPASFKSGSNQGYVTFFANGSTNQQYWTNLANYNGVPGGQTSTNWTPYVLDAFLNEISFGFAGGFVQSPVMGWTNGWVTNNGRITGNTNVGSPNVPIGAMSSPQWWQQTNLYAELQPGSPSVYPWYSEWGQAVFEINPTIYSHPISDRMEYLGFTPGLPLGVANTNTNAWLEVYFYDIEIPQNGSNAPAVTLITTNGIPVPGNVFTNAPFVNPNSSNMIVLAMSNVGGVAQATFPTTQVTVTNTNGGGLYIGNIPEGVSYNPTNQTFTGTISSTTGGWVSIGLMPYGSNGVSVATIPVYIENLIETPEVTNIVVTNSYPLPAALTNAVAALPGETVTLQGKFFIDWQSNRVTQITYGGGTIVTNGFTVNSASNISFIVPSTGWTNGVFQATVNAQRLVTNTEQMTTNTLGIASPETMGIPMPLATNISPLSATTNSPITLQGFFYGVTNVVFFNGSTNQVATTNFTPPMYPYTSLSVVVPPTIPNGPYTQPPFPSGAINIQVQYTNLSPALTTNAISTVNFTLAAPATPPTGPIVVGTNITMGLYQPFWVGGASYYEFKPWFESGATLGAQTLQASNNAASMTAASGARFSATGLPRGLYVVNQNIAGEIFGWIVGAAVETGTNNITITASNSAGFTNQTIPLVIPPGLGFGAASTAAQQFGPSSFNASEGTTTNLTVSFSNGPTAFELSNLPPGMGQTITVVESTPFTNFPSLTAGRFALSLTGTPTTPGTYLVTALAVNVVNSGGGTTTTNSSTFTIIVTGSNAPSFLSFSNWLANYPGLGTNTSASADPDRDGFDNKTEYAFDGNPTLGSPALMTGTAQGGNAVFNFTGLTGASTNYSVQATTNLSTGPWTNSPVTVSNAADQSGLLLSNDYQRREFLVPLSVTNSFFRIQFTNQ
jgi:hypothetical protein